MSGKYSALEHYLQSLPARQRGVVLGFDEIEFILDKKLPHSAYIYEKWWTHESHPRSPQKQAYQRAGWRLCAISLSQQWIEFIRQDRIESRPSRDGSTALRSELPSGRSFGKD